MTNSRQLIASRVYRAVKSRISSGEVGYYDKVDFAQLADTLGVSTTPVRETAMRLMGEGLLEEHPKGGVRLIVRDDECVRSLFALRERLVLWAITSHVADAYSKMAPSLGSSHAQLTSDLFLALATFSREAAVADTVSRLNDYLEPFHRIEIALLEDADAELSALYGATVDRHRLRRLLRRHTRRRMSLVPQLRLFAFAQH